MSDLESIKRTIKSAEDMQTVVRTMKIMASVNIRQFERAEESLGDYARAVETGLGMLLRSNEINGNSLSLAPGLTKYLDTEPMSIHSHTGAIVFGSDQGMCGQFNAMITSFTIESLTQVSEQAQIPPICVGQRVCDSLNNEGILPYHTMRVPGTAAAITSLARELLPVIDRWRMKYSPDRIIVFHNRRVSASAWHPHAVQLLPLRVDRLIRRTTRTRDEHATTDETRVTSRCLPWWSMDTDVLLSRLVRQQLFVTIFRATAESLAGENASRIAAMQAAERNIRDRLTSLKSTHSHRRQTAITEELLDVVTGFTALEDD